MASGGKQQGWDGWSKHHACMCSCAPGAACRVLLHLTLPVLALYSTQHRAAHDRSFQPNWWLLSLL